MEQWLQYVRSTVTTNCKEQKLLEGAYAGNRIDCVQKRGIKLRFGIEQIEWIVRYAFGRFLREAIECNLHLYKH